MADLKQMICQGCGETVEYYEGQGPFRCGSCGSVYESYGAGVGGIRAIQIAGGSGTGSEQLYTDNHFASGQKQPETLQANAEALITPIPNKAIVSKITSYIEKTLMPGEVIIARSRIHWLIYIRPILFFLIALIPCLAYPAFIPLAVFSLIILELICVVHRRATEIAITNRRLVMKSGWLSRKSVELIPEKIESFQFFQGLLGRALNYGVFIVTGIGATKASFHMIEDPLYFYHKVQEVISSHSQVAKITQTA